MTIESVCNPNVATIDADSDARRAAVLMRQEHVGDLIVTRFEEGRVRPVGIITDRDIVVEIVAKGIDPAEVRVGDMLRRELISVDKDASLAFAVQTMRESGVRRVPLIDAHDELLGVLSLDDVIEHLAERLDDIAGTIRKQQRVEAQQLA